MEPIFTDLKSLLVTYDPSTFIAVVSLNRPKKLNAFNLSMFDEITHVFTQIGSLEKDIRAIVLKAEGKHFSAGLDLKEMAPKIIESVGNSDDIGRNAVTVYVLVKKLQATFDSVYNCRIPVIGIAHGYCLGAGTALVSACDINYCTVDAKFSIKEVDLGIVADIGTTQRIAKNNGDMQLLKKVALTGEVFDHSVAKKLNLVIGSFETKEEVENKAFTVAKEITGKSPLVINGLKDSINFAKDNSLERSLDYVARLNAAYLQSQDLLIAAEARTKNKKPIFAKF